MQGILDQIQIQAVTPATSYRFPFLGFLFLKHGDFLNGEAFLFNDDYFVQGIYLSAYDLFSESYHDGRPCINKRHKKKMQLSFIYKKELIYKCCH